MSFFIPHRLSCFICSTKIGERVDAARLFFAHPDDVGELAKHGRAWVHRRCWNDWSLRETWARSAARILTSSLEVESIAPDFVVCRLNEREVLLQDTWLATEVSIPRDRLEQVISALSSSTSHTVTWRGNVLTFAPDEHGLSVTLGDESEKFETFSLEPHTWRAPLMRDVAAAAAGTGGR
jgi:hypothetical protein